LNFVHPRRSQFLPKRLFPPWRLGGRQKVWGLIQKENISPQLLSSVKRTDISTGGKYEKIVFDREVSTCFPPLNSGRKPGCRPAVFSFWFFVYIVVRAFLVKTLPCPVCPGGPYAKLSPGFDGLTISPYRAF
jgi:hypothetical protein